MGCSSTTSWLHAWVSVTNMLGYLAMNDIKVTDARELKVPNMQSHRLPRRSVMYPTKGQMAATASVLAVSIQFPYFVPIDSEMGSKFELTKYSTICDPT